MLVICPRHITVPSHHITYHHIPHTITYHIPSHTITSHHNTSPSLAKPPMTKLNMASLKNRAKLLLSSLPVSPSRVLRAPGTSPYHLVPKHLRATWPRPEQSHLLPEACSPNGTDNRQQRQRQTERPRPNPATFLRDFTLYMTTNYAIIRKRCLN